MQCDQCNGTGEVKQSPYREAANQVKDKLKPVGNVFSRTYRKVKAKIKAGKRAIFMSILKKIGGYVWKIGAVALVVCIVFGIYKYNNYSTIHERQVLVQYNDQGAVIRCWIYHKENFGSWHLKDHYNFSSVNNENKVLGALQDLGAPPNMKCIENDN